MAVVFNLTADATQADAAVRSFQTNITAAFAGIDAKMRETAQRTQQTTATWQSSLTNLSHATIKLVAPQQQLSQVMLQTGKAAETQLSSFDKLRQQYRQTEHASTGLTRQMSSLVTGMKGLAAAAGIGLSIQGLVAFGQSVVEAGIAHDRLMLSLQGALGTAQAAGAAYAFVEGVANRLGIGLLTAVEGFAKLSAATQGTVVQGQQTRDLFVAISEASRVMGLTSVETGGIVTALTQIIGKNTVSMEELRQQLGERLPSALRLTAKEMGVTTSRFIEMVSKGEVLAVDFIPAVTRAMQTMGKEAPAAAQSVQAALERVGNAWLTLKVTIAQSGLLELVARIAEEMTRVINQTTNWLNRTKRLAGELGLAPMVAEMQRVTQEIQRQREMLAAAPAGSPMAANARNATMALEAQRDALAANIALKQQVVEKEDAVRRATDASTQAEINAQAAQDKRLTTLRDASKAYTGLEDDMKAVTLQLEALRSFDVPSLQAMQIDPFGPDFEQRFRERETALLKQQQDLLNKRAGISKSAGMREAQEAGQSAIEVAKAREEALATSLKREELLIQQSADERRRIIDETAAEALRTQGPSDVDTIEATRQRARLQVAVETAQALENIQLDSLTKQEALRATILQAEIASAGKNLSAKVQAEAALSNLHAEMENERAEVTKKRVAVEQQLSKKSVDEQIKNARELNKIMEETAQDHLMSRIDLMDEQIALTEAQMDGDVLTVQAGQARIRVLQQQRFQDTEALYQRQADTAVAAMDAEVRATDIGTAQITQIYQRRDEQITQLQLQQQTQLQRALNEQAQSYRELADGISRTMSDVFEDWLQGTLDLGESIKRWFIRLLADMAAYAAAHTIILPILTSVLGGGGAAGGTGGAGGIVQTVLGAVGLGQNLFGSLGGGGGTSGSTGVLSTGGSVLSIGGLADKAMAALGLPSLTQSVTQGFSSLKHTMLVGIDSLFGTTTAAATQAATVHAAIAAEAVLGIDTAGLGAAGTAGTTSATAAASGASTLGTVASTAGGLTAVVGGIYAALNATNTVSKAAFAASAAAGAAALTSTALIASGVIAASAGWTGIGLIVAGVTALIGTVAGMVMKPAGPALAVGRPSGLGIGVQGGQLAVAGDLGSQVLRQEKIAPGVAQGVQAQMEAGITAAVTSIVHTINAVALDPVALLTPTQEALQSTLRAIQPINSANAKKMEKDITEQLRFVNTRMVAGLLGPLNEAFDQLRDVGSLEEQLARLPGTTQGLVDVFKQMNAQLEELASVENTDVRRQLSVVRSQVEDFGNRLAGTAGQIAESMATGMVTMLEASVRDIEANPRILVNTEGAIADLDQQLATQIETVAVMMTATANARTALQATQQRLEGVGLSGVAVGVQIDQLSRTLGVMSERGGAAIAQTVESLVNSLVTSFTRVAHGIETDPRPMQAANAAVENFDQSLATQVLALATVVTGGVQARMRLQETQQRLEGMGLPSGGVSAQIDRLAAAISDTSARIATEVVSTAMRGLSADLQTIIVQPIRVQALTVGALFNDSITALQALQGAWNQLNEVGLDSTGIQQQFSQLLDDIFTGVTQVLMGAFREGSFAEFLTVAASIPETVTAMNPAWHALQQMAAAFADALAPTLEGMTALEDAMRTTGERSTFAAAQVSELQRAIADAGQSADQALPLYEALGRAVLAQADAEEAAIRETFDRAAEALQGLNEVIEDQTALIADLQGQQEALQSSLEGIITEQDQLISRLTSQQEDMIRGYEALNDELTQALVQLREHITALQDDIQSTLRGQASPARAAEMIRAELTRLQTVAAGQTGTEQVETLTQQKALLDELITLGRSTDQLVLMAEGRQGLEALAMTLDSLSAGLAGQAAANQAQLTTAEAQMHAELALLQAQLDEATATKAAAQAQLDWMIAQTGAQAVTNQSIIAGAQATYVALQTQILQAEADRAIATAQLQQLSGTTDLTAAQTQLTASMEAALQGLRQNTLMQLQAIEESLQALFTAQPLAANLLHLETQTSLQQSMASSAHSSAVYLEHIDNMLGGLNTLINKTDDVIRALTQPLRTVAAQQGGVIARAQGGMVPALLEPQERVFTPPLSHRQQGALIAMNTAFPRFAGGGFMVPGRGSGDRVPMLLPSGSFVLNRRASGFQNGGRAASADHAVLGWPAGSPVTINVYQQPGQNTRELIAEITRQLRREFHSANNRGPFR